MEGFGVSFFVRAHAGRDCGEVLKHSSEDPRDGEGCSQGRQGV